MKTHTFRGARTAVAAGGAALLMLVAGCGGSDEASGDEGTSAEQGAEQSAEQSSEPSADESQDAGAEEDTSSDSGASQEDTSAAEEDSESESSASGVAAPAEDFDPCSVLTPEDVSGVVGFEVGEPEPQEMAGGTICTFPPTGGNVQTAMVQWAPVEGPLSAMADAAKGMFDDASEPEKVTIDGASDGLAFSGEYMSVSAAAVYASVDGGVTQVIVAGDGASVDTAIALTELTLSKA